MFLFTNIPPPPSPPKPPPKRYITEAFGKSKKMKSIKCNNCGRSFFQGFLYTVLLVVIIHIGLAYILLF